MNRNVVIERGGYSLVTLDATVGHPTVAAAIKERVARNRAETIARLSRTPEWQAWLGLTDAQRAERICPFGGMGDHMMELQGIGGRRHVGQ